MKKMKKIAAFIAALAMIAGAAAYSAAADGNETITVSVRVEGLEEAMYYNRTFVTAAGSTVTELLQAVSEAEDSPEITIKQASFGSYVSDVNGLSEFTHGGMSGWNYRVNGLSPMVGIDEYKLENYDEVVCFYGDPFGIGMQYPIANLSGLLKEGVVTFTSIDTTYDEDWKPVETENTVEGATVTLGKKTYTTDGSGQIFLDTEDRVNGPFALQIERFDGETGIPTVLRFAPDNEWFLLFADTTVGAWYLDAVMFCVGEGYFVGTNHAENLFSPLDQMSMLQLITVLSRIGGLSAEQTTGAQWYRAPLEWAIDNDLVSVPEDFPPDGEPDDLIGSLYAEMAHMTVARERFIYLFYTTAAIVGSYDMTLRADITDAVDYDDILDDYQEAVSWALAAGIIRGTSGHVLMIEPAFEVNRATACQMLHNYYC